jgi:dTDP-4-amino-4,6-dideoxygalactose transaminase
LVPFLDLKAQYRQIKSEIDAAIASVIETSNFVLGPAVAGFEQRFADYCGTTDCVAVNSGTSALHLALLAAGIGPGDEVISVAMTFVATAAAILYTGARPVLVDVDPDSWNMDPALVEAAITPRTKAILPVHLHGLMADMDPLIEIARCHGLVVIEDAAQSVGAEYKGRRAGSVGDVGCFSFYPAKNLGAYGEGGAVVTSNSDLADKVRMLHDWGQRAKYDHALPGYNYRMDGIQGAVLSVKLRYIEAWTEARRAVAAHYDRRLAQGGYQRPNPPAHSRHVFHIYAVQVPGRDTVQNALAKTRIGTGIHYPIPVHLQKAYGNLGYQRGDFPVSEAIAQRFLSLPIYAELRPEQIEEVAAALDQAVLNGAGALPGCGGDG